MAEAICLTSQRDSLDKFGCLKCHEGKEILAAQTASHLNRQIKATPVLITKRFTQKRVVRFENRILIPGYVFFKAPPSTSYVVCDDTYASYTLLRYDRSNWELLGADRSFAEWIISLDGIIGFTKAEKREGRICMIDGPLKSVENDIVKVDKKNRNALLQMNVLGREVKIWAGYELVESLGW